MINRVLITGAQGFSGRALLEFLSHDKGCRLFLTDVRPDSSLKDFFPCDLSRPEDVRLLLIETQPDQIYHLTGTFTNDYETDYKANCLSSKNLLDALLALKKQSRVLLIGSAAEYGNAMNGEVPIAEDHPLLPVSVYGLTKVFQTQMMKYYSNNHALDLVMARPFNLFGKGISSKLFVGRVYEQIQEFRSGKIRKIVVGSLQSERDYLHVKRAVGDYQVIMAKGHSGEIYNVGSGQPIKVAALLDQILKEEGLDWSIVEEGNYLSSSVSISFADVSKLKRLKGGE